MMFQSKRVFAAAIDTVTRPSTASQSICRQCARRLPPTRPAAAANFSTSSGSRRKEAETWDNLDFVGSKWKRESTAQIKHNVFRAKRRFPNPQDVKNQLLNALVEVKVAQDEGKPIDWILYPRDDEFPDGVTIVKSKNGSFDIQFAGETSRDEILALITDRRRQPRGAEDTDTGEPVGSKHLREFTTFATSQGEAWRDIKLSDPEFKFLLVKRLRQRLNNPIPDHILHSLTTVGRIFDVLQIQEKPKKLHTAIASIPLIQSAANINIHKTKVSSIDKEKTLGRWKVIEKELAARGLPV